MHKDLIKLADNLDRSGFHKEANIIDQLILKTAEDYSQAAEQAGLSEQALMALTQLMMRFSMNAECITKINELSVDGNISEDELIALIDMGCLRQDESGVADEYAKRTESAVGIINWAKENPGWATLLGLTVSVLIGVSFNWIVRRIRRMLKRSKAKKILKEQQMMRALPAGSQQAYAPERNITPEQMQSLRESRSNKYLAAVAKGYVDVDIMHNTPSFQTISVEYVIVSFDISSFAANINACPDVLVKIPINLFESDSNLVFRAGDRKPIRLNFGSALYGDSLISSELERKCQYFHGFNKSLVIPRVKSVTFSNGFNMPVKFIDGLEIYRGQTLGLN